MSFQKIKSSTSRCFDISIAALHIIAMLFMLMYGGTWFYPVHQNVIWTFILGLLGIHIMETVRKKKKTPAFVLTAILVTIAGGLLGTLTMVDYYGTDKKTPGSRYRTCFRE